MLELKKRELRFRFEDRIEKLNYPTVMQVKTLNEKTNNKKEDQVEVLIDFLKELGMTKETVEQLEVEHLNTVVKELMAAKK